MHLSIYGVYAILHPVILYLLCHHAIPYLVVSLHLLNIDKQALAFILMGTITYPLG